MKKLNPVIRGILGAFGGFAVMMAIDYIKSLIGCEFRPMSTTCTEK